MRVIATRKLHSVDSHVILSATDARGIIVHVSHAFCAISGFRREELIGKPHNIVRHPDMPASLFADLWRTIQSGRCWSGEIKNRTRDGGFYWVKANIEPLIGSEGTIIGYFAVRQDITAQKTMEKLSVTDPMTGAFNRRYFDMVLPREMARARRERHYLAFLMVDADNFKRYNDTYGHHAGDDVLRSIVDVLQQSFLRPGDYIFRLGGEEFAALFPVVRSEDARLVAERARWLMYERAIEHSGNPPHNWVTLSMGMIVLDPAQKYEQDDVYKYADAALYKAKENGRNRLDVHGEGADVELWRGAAASGEG